MVKISNHHILLTGMNPAASCRQGAEPIKAAPPLSLILRFLYQFWDDPRIVFTF